MALFSALSIRRHRSRPELGSQRPPSSPPTSSPPPPKPAFPSSPRPPPARSDSAHSIPVPPPPSPNRLRREASSIGYEALDESTEPESSVEGSAEGSSGGRGGGKLSFAKAAEESANVEMERVGMFRRATKRWSLPALAPTAVFPQPDVPLPLASEQVERLSSPPLRPRSGDKGKRRISGSSLSSTGGLTSPSSPSLSPASSFRSPPTSVSSHSPSSASASTSSLSLNLVISTTINQSNGRRVLASRRSRQMSGEGSFGGGGPGGEGAPTRCKRTKGSYGVGDDEESLWQREEDVFGGIEKASLGGLAGAFLPPPPSLAVGGIGLGLVDGGLRMEQDEAIDEEGQTSRETLHPDFGDFATPTSSPPASLRRPRPPLAPLQTVPHSASPAHAVPTSPTYYRRPPLPLPVPLPPPVQVPQHKPIQPLYPPPPLYPPSPSKTGALSSLTRAYSAYSSSSSDSPTRLKRRNSLQPLRGKSLSKCLSLGGLSGSAARGSASYGPPMTPSSASFSSSTSAHSRRFSAPVSPLTPLSRAPSTSASGCGGDPSTPSSPSFSILTLSVPPTPSVESGESTAPLVGGGWGGGGGGGGGMAGSSSFSSLGHGGTSSSSEAGHSTAAIPPVRRASVVSFELPPSPTLSRRRTQLYPPPPPSPPVQANGFAGGDGGGEGIRRKAHRRAASDGDAMLRQGYSGGGRNGSGWIWGGTVVVRERLFIANPDLPPIPSASLSTALAFEDGPPVPPVPPLPSPFSHHHHHQHHIDRQQQQERNASPLIGIAC